MGIIVVCDTNVFVRETHLLRKKGGGELVRLLRATEGKLLVPDILQTEYIEQTLEAVNEHRQKFEAASGVLATLIGVRYAPLPSNDAIKQTAIDRLHVLESIVHRTPLGTEIYAAAGKRSVAKLRPASRDDHGYKDCLIWESVLRLPAGSDVKFVSRDKKAFFNGDQFAQELVDEARTNDIKVVGYKNVEDLLRDLYSENPMLNLAATEAQDLAATEAAGPHDASVIGTAPVPTVAGSAKLPADVAVAGDVEDVARRLAEARKDIDGFDLKVLAYIAYLDPAGRDQLFQLLDQAGVSPGVARNVVDRLILTGYVRDVGNHYLLVDHAVGEIVAPTVESEIIQLLGKGGNGHGH